MNLLLIAEYMVFLLLLFVVKIKLSLLGCKLDGTKECRSCRKSTELEEQQLFSGAIVENERNVVQNGLL